MSGLVRTVFIIGDLILLNVSILLSYKFKNDTWAITTSDAIYLLVFSNLSWIYLNLVSSPYQVSKGWRMSRLIKSQLAFLFVHLLVVASLVFFFKRNYTFLQLALIYLFFVPSFFAWKIMIFYFRNVFTQQVPIKNYILLGRNPISNEIRKNYLLHPELGYSFKGYFEFEGNDFEIDRIGFFCAEREVHEIQICAPELKQQTLRSLVNFGLDSLIKVKIIAISNARPQSIQYDNQDFAEGRNISAIPLDEPVNQFLKRIFDILFASIFLLSIMSWLLPILAIIIKIDSRGPVFFRQLRSGKRNTPFHCLKFRTMKVNQDADQKQATKDDPRITKLGNFLRKTSLDEFPQFINVFMGSMSVVGPRPHMLKHTEEYGKLIDKFMGRHYVKPGITGLAQCLGYRGETKTLTDMENRIRMDRYYIENWSFFFDMKIIFLTVVSLLRGSDKAY